MRTPAVFLAHGAPPLLDMADWVAELRSWALALPRPEAVLVFSAHWEDRPLRLGATEDAPLVYDFYGFPDRFYRLRYPAPPAPALAARLDALLGGGDAGPGAALGRSGRGLDHGAWVPLLAMYPEADIPVLQASLPGLEPRELFALGTALAPLREEGILVMGSGFLTHNLGAADFSPGASPPAWASDFDAWTAAALAKGDVDALLDYRAKAPGVRSALPTHEHFVPLFVALGAAAGEAASFPITGWFAGSLTKRSVQFGQGSPGRGS